MPAGSTTAISIIVPFRNAGVHFRQLLESLVQQESAESAEILAVDNLSTDNSRAVAQTVGGRWPIRIVEASARANASYARNVGVRAARGDKLLFVDADDEVAPGYVQSMAAALDSHEFVASRVDSVSLNSDWRQDAHGPPWEGLLTYFDFLPGSGINIGLRRGLFQKVGGFPEDLPASQDIAFCWRIQLAGTAIHLVPEALYRYRYRESLRGLYRQTRNWGTSNVLLYRLFREAGMPGRTLRAGLDEWGGVIAGLARARTKRQLAPVVCRLGYCVGRLLGSMRFGRMYL